jgi:AraC family ethanolamine operon transcriptional activator
MNVSTSFFRQSEKMASKSSQIAPPRLLVNQSFNDMCMLGEAIEWDLDFRQIEAGELNARAMLLAGHQNMAMRVEFDRKFHQRGCAPPGILTFGFPDRKSGPLRWNGREAKPGALLNFNDGRLEGVNPGIFGGYTLSFTEDLLHQVAGVLSIKFDLCSSIQSIAFWDSQGPEHNRLRNILRSLERAVLTNGQSGLQNLTEAFNFDLAASVVCILGHDHIQPPRETAPFRAGALKRALRFIDDPDQPSLSVAEICKIVGASLATLERAFTEEFGVSPKAYIQSKRLDSARKQLIKSESGTLIADVANRWGFWHMGRFASDYRRQFGELPSQTLQSRE